MYQILLLRETEKMFVCTDKDTAINKCWSGIDGLSKRIDRQNLPLLAGLDHNNLSLLRSGVNTPIRGHRRRVIVAQRPGQARERLSCPALSQSADRAGPDLVVIVLDELHELAHRGAARHCPPA